MKVLFPYIAQLHQIPHSLPIACELALRYPGLEVHVAYAFDEQREFIRQIVDLYGIVPLHYHHLRTHWLDPARLAGAQSHWKQLTLLSNRSYLSGFDAVVTPEQTSLFVRKLGLPGTRLIWTRHGAGDRQVGFRKRTREFDFVLMAGHKIERRMLDLALIRPGDYAVGVYAKFDYFRKRCGARQRIFENDRPTVLYNPHFRNSLSSWPLVGRQVLDIFASGSRYNLIFAPHVRLFGGSEKIEARLFSQYRGLPHVRIDLGSVRSVDMSYTAAADIYLGDVSSQVAEFVLNPRPCLFLNPHRVSWQSDANYASWKLGPVTDSANDLEEKVTQAIESHGRFVKAQHEYFSDSFDLPSTQASAARGADAIMDFLWRSRAIRQAHAYDWLEEQEA